MLLLYFDLPKDEVACLIAAKQTLWEAPCQTTGFNQQPDIIALVVNVPSLLGNSRAKRGQFQKKQRRGGFSSKFTANSLLVQHANGKLVVGLARR